MNIRPAVKPILILGVMPSRRLKEKNILSLSSEALAIGQKAWLVGCPYSDGPSCKQNLYEMTFSATVLRPDIGLFALNGSDQNLNLSGFSGAPIVNSNREAIGVLSGAGEDGSVLATLLPNNLNVPYADTHSSFEHVNCADAETCVLTGVGAITGGWNNHDLAEKFFSYACEIGNGETCTAISTSYATGDPTRLNPALARVYAEKACAKPQPFCGLLAKDLIQEDMDYNDLQLAQEYLQKSCDSGESGTCRALKSFNRKIVNTPLGEHLKNQAECDSGVPLACYHIGFEKFYGLGVHQHRPDGLELLEFACNEGIQNSCAELGIIYSAGDGIPQDVEKAFPYLKTGCDDLQRSDSCFNLGLSLLLGIDIQSNQDKGMQYMRMSCELGFEKACDVLSEQ